MASPLLPHEVLKLVDSSYMELLVGTFKHFDIINVDNCKKIIEELNASIYIEEKDAERFSFKFRSNHVLACSGSFSFKNRKLVRFGYTIQPQGYLKKRVSKKQYQRIIAMFTKISEIENAIVEKPAANLTKFIFDNKILVINGNRHMLTNTYMVAATCEKRK